MDELILFLTRPELADQTLATIARDPRSATDRWRLTSDQPARGRDGERTPARAAACEGGAPQLVSSLLNIYR